MLVDGVLVGVVLTYTLSNVTTDSAISVILNSPVRINRQTPVYFSTLQAADNVARNGDVIQTRGIDLTGNFINSDGGNTLKITNNVTVTLAGGYNCGFTTNIGNVTLLQRMIQTFSTGGPLTIENFDLVH